MRRTIPTTIVGTTTLLREGLIKILRPMGFREAASKQSMAEIKAGDFPPSGPCLLIIQCSDSSQLVIPQITTVKQQVPPVRIALLGRRWPPDEIAAAFQAGANAYFAEATASEEFVRAIELIMLGRQTILPIELGLGPPLIEHDSRTTLVGSAQESKLLPRPSLHLSPREIRILQCLVQGTPNKVIAREIQISEATVKVHVKAILRKTGAANRTQAAIWAMSYACLVADDPKRPANQADLGSSEEPRKLAPSGQPLAPPPFSATSKYQDEKWN